jgi:hypothetical protein
MRSTFRVDAVVRSIFEGGSGQASNCSDQSSAAAAAAAAGQINHQLLLLLLVLLV